MRLVVRVGAHVPRGEDLPRGVGRPRARDLELARVVEVRPRPRALVLRRVGQHAAERERRLASLVDMALCSVLPISLNPTVMLPWAMPTFIGAFFSGGPLYMLVILICMASSALLYYPLFKIADNQALAEEQAIADEHEAA